jgi:PIN domain nuclease of toxin-antitoxin system
MILLDTHTWVWWVHGDPRLPNTHAETIRENEGDVIAVSIISCWEVAKLVEYRRFSQALTYPGISLLDLTPEIVVESVQLPGQFHRDPADQLIVATARIHECPLLTSDSRIRDYAHVETPA